MKCFIFTAGGNFSESTFNCIDKFCEVFPESFAVSLDNEIQLNQLLNLIGLNKPVKKMLLDSKFEYYYDFSTQKITEFSNEEFEKFYTKWLTETNRENSMDEYGQLIFILGQARSWNQEQHILVLHE